MKILYGVQATGNGHISRARAFAEAFERYPEIQVDWLFSGREPSQLFDMQAFGDFTWRKGLTFQTRSGRIDPLSTAREVNIKQLLQDVRDLSLQGYDLVLSDFDPVSAWAAKRQKVPSVAVSHQAAFLYDIPKPKNSLWHQGVMSYFAPTDVALGVHWHHFDQPVLPPVLERMSTPMATAANSSIIAVYMPFEDPREIQQVLEPLQHKAGFRSYQFVCYHPLVSESYQAENVQWHKPSRADFLEILLGCRGVICNAGFELPSEALALGKSLLVKPLQGQFEQQANAMALEQLGYGQACNKLETRLVANWLARMSLQSPIAWPDVPDAVIQWLKRGELGQRERLVESLWLPERMPVRRVA